MALAKNLGATTDVPRIFDASLGLRFVGWHVLRHTFASHLAMRGAPLKAIQELLGHATIMMTMRYAHLAPQVAREAVCLLDGLVENRGQKRGELS
jgi:integrase